MRAAPLLLLILSTSQIALAADFQVGEERSVSVGGLLQPSLRLTSDESPKGGSSNDAYMRRIRLLLGAKLGKLSAFIGTDQPNFGGREVGFDPQFAFFYVEDAVLSYDFDESLTIDAGLLLLPMSHHSLESSARLNTLDEQAAALKLPPGSGIHLRDGGVVARGLLFDERFYYRTGVFQGVKSQRAGLSTRGTVSANPQDYPRVAGQVRFNVLGSENSLFFEGIHFGSEPLVSIGVGGGYQPDASFLSGSFYDYLALSTDAYADYPLGSDLELVTQLGASYYAQGDRNPDTGVGVFGEVGVRIGRFEPVVSVENFFHTTQRLTLDSTVRSSNFFAVRGGLNYFIDRHTFNIKGEVALQRFQDRTVESPLDLKQNVVATVQAQVLF